MRLRTMRLAGRGGACDGDVRAAQAGAGGRGSTGETKARGIFDIFIEKNSYLLLILDMNILKIEVISGEAYLPLSSTYPRL